MVNSIYSILKEKAIKKAGQIGAPEFYSSCRDMLEKSAALFASSNLISICRTCLSSTQLHPAHGIPHSEKVALEAGAILCRESAKASYNPAETEALMLSAQVAGMLHDIKRLEHDHTISGSIKAGEIIDRFDLAPGHRDYIVAAIRNHEAFKEVLESENETAKLVSDSLYDADKFRWGPDNFTVTLWLITESSGISPEALFGCFEDKLHGIRKIKQTFRTETGQRFGPEFIDMGIEIADVIYAEMKDLVWGY